MISLTWKYGISKLTHQHRQSNCIFRIDFYFLSLGILTTCGLQTYLFVMFFSFCFCKVFENMFGWFMFWVFGYLSPSKLECWRPWYLAPLLQREHYQAKFLLKPYDGLVAVPETAIRMVHSRLHGSPCESFSILFFIVRPSIWVVIVHCHLASCDGSS